MGILIALYVWCAMWWGVFCVLMHTKTHRSITFNKMCIVLFLNVMGMPVSLVIAAWNTAKELSKMQ